jgi:hypothetical protein
MLISLRLLPYLAVPEELELTLYVTVCWQGCPAEHSDASTFCKEVEYTEVSCRGFELGCWSEVMS